MTPDLFTEKFLSFALADCRAPQSHFGGRGEQAFIASSFAALPQHVATGVLAITADIFCGYVSEFFK